MDQVKFHISPSPDLLPLLLLLRVWHIFPLHDDRQVRRQKCFQTALYKCKRVLLILLLLIQVVKEDAPYTSRLLAVFVGEVVVTPFLKAGVVRLVVGITRFLYRLVEVDTILVKEVAWGEVGASSEPPRVWGPVFIHGLEVAVVEVDGW